LSLQETGDFAGCDFAASDDEDGAALQLYEYGK
jgi:hypothetical protein